MAVLKKNAKGYGYKYTDIAEINSSLEEMGITYYQYIERIDGDDYVMTVPIIDGQEKPARMGCKIVVAPFDKKSNPAQEQGSGITYARRYSLLMAFGLATTDDDAQCMTREKKDEGKVKGYPSRETMLEVIRNKYPEGSDQLKNLLEYGKTDSLDKFTDEQICNVYNKIGSK